MKRRPPGGARRTRARWVHRLQNELHDHRRNALSSLRRLAATPFQSALTVAVLAVALALPAALLVAVAELERIAGGLDLEGQITVFLRREVVPEAGRALAEQLAQRPQLAAARYVSSAEALAQFREHSGWGDLVELLDENPLPASIELVPARPLAEDLEALRGLAAELEARPEVDQVVLDVAWLERLAALATLVRRVGWGLGATLALGVLLVVGNTVRLAVESRREEIQVVMWVGGTDAYVRRPFLYTGLWLGGGAGLGAFFLVWLGFRLLRLAVAPAAEFYPALDQLGGPGAAACAALVGVGALLGLVGARLAVAAQLRTLRGP
ncbi:MAG: cell division protein FtsX [Porticoccaceae bacterium]|nr:MAG: cell division protein FtsX [Porticoccaceae bacterium]